MWPDTSSSGELNMIARNYMPTQIVDQPFSYTVLFVCIAKNRWKATESRNTSSAIPLSLC